MKILNLIGIIDIGSTGTRLNMYGYTHNKKLIFYREHKIDGGLHELPVWDIKTRIQKLVQKVKEYSVQDNKSVYKTKNYINKIPIGVYCTAGFRSIRRRDRYKRLAYVYKLIRNLNVKEIGIISGKYEGYLGYISLSYLINKKDFLLIDMGGKSTQVVSKTSIKSYNIGTTNITHNLDNGLKDGKDILHGIESQHDKGMDADKLHGDSSVSNDVQTDNSLSADTQKENVRTDSLQTDSLQTDILQGDNVLTDIIQGDNVRTDILQGDNSLGGIEKVNTNTKIYIKSYYTKDMKKVRINDIQNVYMRRFLRKLGIHENTCMTSVENVHGVDVNWCLGMSLRFL